MTELTILASYAVFCVFVVWLFDYHLRKGRESAEFRRIQGPGSRVDYFSARYDPHRFDAHDPMPRNR